LQPFSSRSARTRSSRAWPGRCAVAARDISWGDAIVIGDGVLAQAERANVVFWQLPPYDVAPAAVLENQWVRNGLEQYNLKKTFRRTSFTLTGLLANMGVAGATPIVARFSSSVGEDGAEKRWLEGLYLDQPEEWDDPYRFFGW
jgi:hypothetical protein